MTEIIPAILPKDYLDLRSSLARVRFLSPFVQIDICDGNYVPSVTWPYGDPEKFQSILDGDEGLPFWEDFQFELDLMVRNPEEVLADWIDAGASRIIIHNKSTAKLDEILTTLENAGIEAGIALGVDEDVSLIRPYAERVLFVQCMGIAHIGVQGNPFDARVLTQIKAIRAQFPQLTVSVDGGVNIHTVEKLVEAGAHRLVSGSAILRAEDSKSALEEMRALANSSSNSPQA
ncbi:MAG: hypothetical protein WDZ74_00795 [Candidatus Paceibacterota bacterium]